MTRHSQQTDSTTVAFAGIGDRATVAVVASVLALLFACGALLVTGHALYSLELAALLTVTLTAIAWPRPYRIVAALGLAALPFLAVVSALRPAEVNHASYYALFVMLLVLTGATHRRFLPRSMGTVYLGYIVLAAFAAFLITSGEFPAATLAYPVAGFGMFVLIMRADEGERRVVLGVLLTLAIAESVLGILQTTLGVPVFPEVLEELVQGDRNFFAYVIPGLSSTVTLAAGTFSHFNALGAVLAPAVPVAFSLWLGRLRSLPRLGLFLLLLTGTIVTFSRGALLGALAGIVLVVLFETSSSKRATVVLVGCIAVIGTLLATSTIAQYTEATGNVEIRAQTWRYAIDDALGRPSNLVFGYGFRHFTESVLTSGLGSQGTLTLRSTIAKSLHSGPLQLLLEFGLVGVLLFVSWIYQVARKGLGRARSRMSVALIAAGLAFMCHQTLDTSFFAFPGVLFIAYFALAEATAADTERQAATR